MKSEFNSKKSDFAYLHWDEKLIDNVMGSTDERLAVLISGSPHYTEGKVLGITTLTDEEGNPTSTGESQFEAFMKLVEEWDINICEMCFDTTSSNTGRHRGACTRLESGYRKGKVFWFGCRHHVIEPIAKVVWYLLFEDNQGPDKKTYQGGKDMWGDLDTLSTAQIKKLVVRSPFLQKLKSDATEFYEKVFTEKHRNQTLPRDDYRELAESSLILLGGIPPGGISWKKPGPVHKARFMANGLYSNKMFAFQEVLDYDVEDVAALRRFVLFNVHLYAPKFLSAGVGADAPINDLVFFKPLCKFQSIDAELSATTLHEIRCIMAGALMTS